MIFLKHDVTITLFMEYLKKVCVFLNPLILKPILVFQSTLSSTIIQASYTAEPMILGNITILGVEVAPTSVVINGQVYTDHYSYNNKVSERVQPHTI